MAVRIKAKAGISRYMDASDTPTFEAWLQRVDNLLLRYLVIGTEYLVDIDYMSLYDDRVRPIHAANKAIKASGGDY